MLMFILDLNFCQLKIGNRVSSYFSVKDEWKLLLFLEINV